MRTANMIYGNVRLPIAKDAPEDGKLYGRKNKEWSEITSGTKPLQVTGLILFHDNWVVDGNLYKYFLSHDSITANSIVDIIPANADIDVVKSAEILPETDSASGSVTVYAVNEPTGDISVTLNIFEVTT